MLRSFVALALITGCASATGARDATPTRPAPARAAPTEPPPDPPPAAPLSPIEREVLGAVEADPTVVAMCADSARQGGPCVVYVDAPGVGTCPPHLAELHPCLWTVAVMANMGTHASRRATMLVRPDGVVVAAANLFCPPMRPADWARVERASLAGRPVDDCPPHVPEVGEPPSP